jgi:hypothetical protein
VINWTVDLTVGGFEKVPLGVRHDCILAKSILENKTEIGGCENSVGCTFAEMGGDLDLSVRGVILGWLPGIGSLECGSELPSFCP